MANDVMEGILMEVKRETEIPVDMRSIENVLAAVAVSSDFWDIVRISEEPLPLVSCIIKVLQRHGMLRCDDIITLEEHADVHVHEKRDYVCKCCHGRTTDITDTYENILKVFREIVKMRPAPRYNFDQGHVTPETTIARVVLMHSRGDVASKNILVLGDDDLVSVALALSGLPKRVFVMDIDERLIKFIKSASRGVDVDVEAIVCDLRDEFPDDLRGKFDTFSTDPSETLTALRAFIGRGIAALRKSRRSAGYFGLTRVESSLYKWFNLQKMLLNDFNVVITDIIRNFNEYELWKYEDKTDEDIRNAARESGTVVTKLPEKRWYYSYLIRIETFEHSTGFTERISETEFYMDAESSFI